MTSPRRILVTGASRGLGRAMVDGFVEAGHQVVGCGRRAEAMDELRSAYGGGHRFDVVDVADDQQVAEWAAQVVVDGPPDLLLNNAALINRNAPLWEVPVDEFDRVIDVNIKGVYRILRHFLPPMLAAGSGVVVNFSSGWGRSTSPEVAPYCATKFGIEGLTAALASELPAGMAAVALNPGIIHTDMLDSCFGAGASSFPSPASWAERAVPFLLRLGPADNGSALTAPG